MTDTTTELIVADPCISCCKTGTHLRCRYIYCSFAHTEWGRLERRVLLFANRFKSINHFSCCARYEIHYSCGEDVHEDAVVAKSIPPPSLFDSNSDAVFRVQVITALASQGSVSEASRSDSRFVPYRDSKVRKS